MPPSIRPRTTLLPRVKRLGNATQKAVVTPEMQSVAQMVLDPQTWIEFGRKIRANSQSGCPNGPVRTAAANLAKTSRDRQQSRRPERSFQGGHPGPERYVEERIAAQRTLGAMTPVERDAQAAVAKATQAHQAAIDTLNQEMTDAAQPSAGRFASGK